MGKDRRPWRKIVKKLRRKRIRQANAINLPRINENEEESQLSICDQEKLAEIQRLHQLEEEAWLEREREAARIFQLKKVAEMEAAAEKERIKKEAEEKQLILLEKLREDERIANEKKAKQEEEFEKLLDFLTGDIETPPVAFLMPEEKQSLVEPCLFFSRTGACRFYDRCRNPHPSPLLSSTIVITNFFTHPSLENILIDDDSYLEYSNCDIERSFLEFYHDVLPELKKYGKVIQFKVCRNLEPHLRGNVYVQFQTIREAVAAYRKFNGRFYNGRQLTLRFIKLISWKTAICGQFIRRACVKGRSCNYLHVFRNPTNEFCKADHDWESRSSDSTRSHSKSVRTESGRSFESTWTRYNSTSSRSRSPSLNRNQRSSKSRSPSYRSSSSKTSRNDYNVNVRKSHKLTSSSLGSENKSKTKKHKKKASSGRIKSKSGSEENIAKSFEEVDYDFLFLQASVTPNASGGSSPEDTRSSVQSIKESNSLSSSSSRKHSKKRKKKKDNSSCLRSSRHRSLSSIKKKKHRHVKKKSKKKKEKSRDE